MEMVDRIVARIEDAKNNGTTEDGEAMYYLYFKVALYRKLFKADVDDILMLDGYEDCIMTVEEIANQGV